MKTRFVSLLTCLSLCSCTTALLTPQQNAPVGSTQSSQPSTKQGGKLSIESSIKPSITPSSSSIQQQPIPTPLSTSGFDTDEPCLSSSGTSLDQPPSELPCVEVSTLNIVSGEAGISDAEMRARISYRLIYFNSETRSLLVEGNETDEIIELSFMNKTTVSAKIWLNFRRASDITNDQKTSLYLSSSSADNLFVMSSKESLIKIYRITPEKKMEPFFDFTTLGISADSIGFVSVIGKNIFLINHKKKEILKIHEDKNISAVLSEFSKEVSYTSNIRKSKNTFFMSKSDCIFAFSDKGLKTAAGDCERTLPYPNSFLLEDKELPEKQMFKNVADIEVNKAGELIILDSETGIIYKITSDGTRVLPLTGGTEFFSCDDWRLDFSNSFSRNDTLVDGSGGKAKFLCPNDIALTNDDNIMYVADYENKAFRQVRVYYSSKAKPYWWNKISDPSRGIRSALE